VRGSFTNAAPKKKPRKEVWTGEKSGKVLLTTPSKIGRADKNADENKSLITPSTSGQELITVQPDQTLYRPPQSLSHLSHDTVDVLVKLTKGIHNIEEPSFESGSGSASGSGPGPGPGPGSSLVQRQRSVKMGHSDFFHAEPARAFTFQSIYYVFSTPEAMIKSFKNDESSSRSKAGGLHLDPHRLDESLRLLLRENTALMFHSLWQGIECLFTPPPDLFPPRSPKLKTAMSTHSVPTNTREEFNNGASGPAFPYLSDLEAAHIVILCLQALSAALPKLNPEIWLAIHKLRAQGSIVPDFSFGVAKSLVEPLLESIEVFEDDMALRLMERLVRGIASRAQFNEMLKIRDKSTNNQPTFFDILRQYYEESRMQHLEDDKTLASTKLPLGGGLSLANGTVEWARGVLLKNWDGKQEIARSSIAGSAIQLLSFLCRLLIDIFFGGEGLF
jgi:hypothetical protein